MNSVRPIHSSSACAALRARQLLLEGHDQAARRDGDLALAAQAVDGVQRPDRLVEAARVGERCRRVRRGPAKIDEEDRPERSGPAALADPLGAGR